MTPDARTTARFVEAIPGRVAERVGVTLCFRPVTSRLGVDLIEDWAELGPELSVPAVAGLGRVLRVLRAARVRAPDDPALLAGDLDATVLLLGRAVGTTLRLSLRRRTSMRFLVWGEDGFQSVDDVADVREYDDAFVVYRRDQHFPLRFDRGSVLRQRTECDSWYEVLDIERA